VPNTCAECRHYEPADDAVGYCLESSPQVVVLTVELPDEAGAFTPTATPVSVWPQVAGANRCGKWAPAPMASRLRVISDADDQL
jgi:hypothetical protein